MRIAIFCWEFYPRLVGGLGTYAVEISRKFREMGNEVTVFTLNDGSLKTKEEWNGIEVHRPLILDVSSIFPFIVTEDLKKWGTSIKLFSDIFAYNLLSATKFVNFCIKKEKRKFDVVAIHDWLSSITGLAIRKELEKIPIVFHLHSVEEQRSLGGGSEVIKHLERTMAEKADKIITVSDPMKDLLIKINYPQEKINVCYNGCDPKKYDPKKVNNEKLEKLKELYGIKDGEKVIFFIGRLTWVKGVKNLIKAMPSVLKDFPESKLIIIGKGEDYSELLELSRKLGIEDRVKIRSEWVSEEERILHYALADVCVFPSISEPFGIVSLEAMSMEKPVVVGAAGISGLRHQVIPSGINRTGTHVNGEDPEDIAWGIKETFKNFEEAKKWGKNGRKRVLKEFTWEIAAKNTLKIYKSLLE
ncbi:MAG: glycosyltransferase family 4 protein [Candidatus Aenigmatarchaeota archaeon]